MHVAWPSGRRGPGQPLAGVFAHCITNVTAAGYAFATGHIHVVGPKRSLFRQEQELAGGTGPCALSPGNRPGRSGWIRPRPCCGFTSWAVSGSPFTNCSSCASPNAASRTSIVPSPPAPRRPTSCSCAGSRAPGAASCWSPTPCTWRRRPPACRPSCAPAAPCWSAAAPGSTPATASARAARMASRSRPPTTSAVLRRQRGGAARRRLARRRTAARRAASRRRRLATALSPAPALQPAKRASCISRRRLRVRRKAKVSPPSVYSASSATCASRYSGTRRS